MDFILAQAVGFIALLFFIISFQLNTHKGIMFCQTAAMSLFTIHFYLIGAPTGAAMNAIAVVRGIVFYHRDKKWASGRIWPILFCAAFILFGLITWQGPLSLLSIVTMLINTYSFAATDPTVTRVTILFAVPFSLIYNIICLSIPGILNDSLAFFSTIVGIFRFDRGRLRTMIKERISKR